MKKITISEMETLNGGMKCIYHGMIAVGATVGLGLVGIAVGLASGIHKDIAACWNS